MSDRTLIDRVHALLDTDDEDRVKQSQYLLSAYHEAERAGPAAVAALDNAFIALCGYALTSLLKEFNIPTGPRFSVGQIVLYKGVAYAVGGYHQATEDDLQTGVWKYRLTDLQGDGGYVNVPESELLAASWP